MVRLLLSIFRLAWPFIKESVFEGSTLAAWIKRNRLTCTWILMLVIMLVSMFWMADQLIQARQQDAVKTQKIATLTSKYNNLASRYNYYLEQTKLERNRVGRLRVLIVDSCPPDSRAYRALVAGIESLDEPNARQLDISVSWCRVVQEKDLVNDQIRQRYLMECGSNP